MPRETQLSRRAGLTLAGAVASTVLLAGCSGDDGGNGDEDSVPAEWADVDELFLEGTSDNWIGIEPSVIDGVPNPTLVLVEGREYELTWENVDGQPHNFVILDGNGAPFELVTEDGDIVEGTELIDEAGKTQRVTFEAETGMAEYVCGPHLNRMVGRIELAAE